MNTISSRLTLKGLQRVKSMVEDNKKRHANLCPAEVTMDHVKVGDELLRKTIEEDGYQIARNNNYQGSKEELDETIKQVTEVLIKTYAQSIAQ